MIVIFTTRVATGFVANVVRLDLVEDDTFTLVGSTTTETARSRYAARARAAEQLGVTPYQLRKTRGQCVL